MKAGRDFVYVTLQEYIGQGIPILATSLYKLILLGQGGNAVGILRSELPFRQPVKVQGINWKRPIFILTVAAVGYWQFLRIR